MPSRFRTLTGAPFNRAFSHVPKNERKTAAKINATIPIGTHRTSGEILLMEF
jgi:hypothetical protein